MRKCRKVEATSGQLCLRCREKQREKAKRHYRKNKEKVLEKAAEGRRQRKAERRCVDCGKANDRKTLRCSACSPIHNTKSSEGKKSAREMRSILRMLNKRMEDRRKSAPAKKKRKYVSKILQAPVAPKMDDLDVLGPYDVPMAAKEERSMKVRVLDLESIRRGATWVD